MSVQDSTEQLWGGETTKAVANFPVSGERVPVSVVRQLGRLKGAAARANADLGLLDSSAWPRRRCSSDAEGFSHDCWRQHVPQTSRPSGQAMPAAPASSGPQNSLHVACIAQVTEQLPSHLTSQFEVASQLAVLFGPRSNLQVAPFLHVACEPAPDLSSHFDEASQLTRLPSPPLPLHSADCAQPIVTAPVEFASHLVSVAQSMEQFADPQLALQSRPLAHVQLP